MDVAVSSGVSTLEWSDHLSANGFQHKLIAGDLVIDGWLMSWGGWFAVLLDGSGQEPLLLEIGPVTRPVQSDRWLAKAARPLLSPLLRALAAGTRRRSVSLVSAELRRRPEIEVAFHRVLTSSGLPTWYSPHTSTRAR
jgi:hypothetical protein